MFNVYACLTTFSSFTWQTAAQKTYYLLNWHHVKLSRIRLITIFDQTMSHDFPPLHHSPQTEWTQPPTPANINNTTVCSPAQMRHSDASCHMSWPFTDIIFNICMIKMEKTSRHFLYILRRCWHTLSKMFKNVQTQKCHWLTCLGEHQKKLQRVQMNVTKCNMD